MKMAQHNGNKKREKNKRIRRKQKNFFSKKNMQSFYLHSLFLCTNSNDNEKAWYKVKNDILIIY